MASTATRVLKSLKIAPGTGPLFLFTSKNLAEDIISQTSKASSKPDQVMTMWLGPKRMVIATHPETAREIIRNAKVFQKASAPPNPHDPMQRLFSSPSGAPQVSVVSANGQQWAKQRKILDPSFTTTAVENLVPLFSKEVDVFLDVIDKHAKANKELDVTSATSHFALDVLGSAVLGRPFGAQDGTFSQTYDSYKYIMSKLIDPAFMAFPILHQLPLERKTKLTKAVDVMYNVLSGAIEQRLVERAQPGGMENYPRDLLDMVLANEGASEGLPASSGLGVEGLDRDLLIPNLWIFFIAGHDTTAISLAWVMDAFARHPHIQTKAREEATRLFGADVKKNPKAVPTLDQIKGAEYLEAVIKEALRLHPPVHNLMTRVAVEDTELGGYFVPKNTSISISISAVNRHPDVWEDPNEFRPERFLQERRVRAYNMMSFSAGPRRCLGDRFSVLEQKTLLMKLLCRFEILPCGDQTVELPLSSASAPIMFAQPETLRIKAKAI